MDEAVRALASWFGIGIAGTFAVAGTLKLAARADFRRQLADYQLLPAPLLTPLATVLPVAECLAAAAYLIPSTRSVSLAAMLVMLAAFSAAIVTAIRAGRTTISCACFGAKSTILNRRLLVRNAGLALGAGLALALPGGDLNAAAAFALAAAALLIGIVITALDNDILEIRSP